MSDDELKPLNYHEREVNKALILLSDWYVASHDGTDKQTEAAFLAVCRELKDAIAAALASIDRAAPGWISVEKRLPGDGVPVLTIDELGLRRTGCHIYHTWFAPTPNAKITHWQPLPEPPQGGEG